MNQPKETNMTLAITINLILSAIVFAAVVHLLSRSMVSSRPTPAAKPVRIEKAPKLSSDRSGLRTRSGLDLQA
jgi:hypothetical protein